MARGSARELSIARLENMLSERKDELNGLRKHREKLQRQLDVVDERISMLAGSNGRARSGRRPRNEMSLVDTLEQVLKGAGKPMKIGEIVEGVQKEGYQSSSVNFRGIVNQTLIKEKQFSSPSRGLYQLKK